MEPSRVELTGKLSGRRIVLTAQRRAEQLASALQRHGASIVHAPTLSVIPHIDDPELIARTRALIKHRPDIVVVTTGVRSEERRVGKEGRWRCQGEGQEKTRRYT